MALTLDDVRRIATLSRRRRGLLFVLGALAVDALGPPLGDPAGSGGFALAAPAPAAAAAARAPLRATLESGVEATLTDSQEIAFLVTPRSGEGLYALSRRMCGDDHLAPQIAEANGGSLDLHAGAVYRIPYDLAAPDWRLKAIKALFGDDRGESDGWRHRVRGVGPLQREGLWQLAQWFTGIGENFRAIREYNEIGDDDVARGRDVTIPAELLLPAFRAQLPAPDKPFRLDYGKDAQGEYAVYRLRPGEALYSAVVVRFTGRLFAADVNSLAAQIAKRNGIPDVTDIPIGYRVKIPLDFVQPEFLPEGHPKRQEYEASLRASSQFSNQVRAQGLAGITVILDAGHGGHDVGASVAGVWESLYVYDIVMRAKHLLETETAAKVFVTTRDGEQFRVRESDVLPYSRGHAVLTSPPYPIADPKVGVNLRWYLANSVYRRVLQQDRDPQKVVFLSVHADSLHPSLRGMMAYFPAADMRSDSYGKEGAVYAARKEVQEAPRVDFPREERVQSEGLSRQLARRIVGAFEAAYLPVHPFNPVRDKIIRNNSEWVPAVLRYNSVPAKILLEVCNLGNDQDRSLIQTSAYRQKVAQAMVRGLRAYYDQAGETPASQVAASSK